MGTDIRKPKSSHAVGIQRIRDSTTVSTSASSDMSRGRDGNELDEEEAVGDDFSAERGFPLDEDDEDRQYIFREDHMEHIAEGPSRHRSPEDDDFDESDSDDDDHPPTMRQRMGRVWKWVKKFLIPTPSATAAAIENPQAPITGPTYTRRFKAPPGKRILPFQSI